MPRATKAKKFSGQLVARLGPGLHERLASTARKTRSSMNELLVLALTLFLDWDEKDIVGLLNEKAKDA